MVADSIKQNMRVLFCSIYSPFGHDGVSSSTRELIQALQKIDIDVTVYTTDWRWEKKNSSHEIPSNVKVFHAHFGNNFEYSRSLVNSFRKECTKYDIVHFNSIYSATTVICSAIARKKKIPYIISPRGNFIPSPKINRQGIRSGVKKELFFTLFSANALKKANVVICSSDLEMNSIKSRLTARCFTVINNGFNISECTQQEIDENIIEQSLGIPQSKSLFLFLGRLAEEKAIPFLIDVWDDVCKDLKDPLLILAGPDDHGSVKKIKQHANALACAKTIKLVGPVSGSLKQALLARSKMLLLPSYFESFGNVVLEALASGIPVAASVGTPWQILEEKNFGSWLPWEKEQWRDAIISTYNNEHFYSAEFKKKAHTWVQDEFNWPVIANHYLKTYTGAINDSQKDFI